jgi:nucleotide-binding universal stress UspA family protein
MQRLERILLPVDLRGMSPPVVNQAAILARHFGSEVLLLHVVTPLSYSAGMLEGAYVPTSIEDLQNALLRQAQDSLERFLSPELEGITLKRTLRKGDPAQCIVQEARAQGADLIMMPTHGYGAFRRFLLGSVAAKVLHDWEGPVWTGAHIESQAAHKFDLRHIMCAVDLGAHSLSTLQWAADLSKEFGVRLSLIHVTPVPESYGNEHLSAHPASRMVAEAAAEKLTRLQERAGTRAEVILRFGEVGKTLRLLVQEKGGDLLVIGRPPGARLRAAGTASSVNALYPFSACDASSGCSHWRPAVINVTSDCDA